MTKPPGTTWTLWTSFAEHVTPLNYSEEEKERAWTWFLRGYQCCLESEITKFHIRKNGKIE